MNNIIFCTSTFAIIFILCLHKKKAKDEGDCNTVFFLLHLGHDVLILYANIEDINL